MRNKDTASIDSGGDHNMNPIELVKMEVAKKSKPTIAQNDLQFTASTHNSQTLELKRGLIDINLERDFPVEVMGSHSLEQTSIFKGEIISSKRPRLVRTYSETDTSHFNPTTGAREFDDLKHRPFHGLPSSTHLSTLSQIQKEELQRTNSFQKTVQISRDQVSSGIEDEYVPDFNFSDNLLHKWFDEDELSSYNSQSQLFTYNAHTDLKPISVPKVSRADHLKIDISSLKSLPTNFKELPFSQRKKLLLQIYPNHSYKDLSSLVKTQTRSSSSSSVLASYLSNLNQTETQLYDVNKKGAIVMNHVLMDVVGRGAWGVIRECRDLETDKLRAVKIISIQNDKVKKIFMNEINIWSILNHENILPLLKYKETHDNIFAITKLNYGGSLFELVYKWGFLKLLKISVKEREIRTMAILKQVLNGLSYMHDEMHLIHGDIKLENILIDSHDKIMICDFGMSRYYSRRPVVMKRTKSDQTITNIEKVYDKTKTNDDSILTVSHLNKLGPSLTSTFLVPTKIDSLQISDTPVISDSQSGDGFKIPDKNIGSLPYLAPELLAPQVEVSTKRDIYAVGVLLYTMLTGDLPFHHDYEPRLRMMILQNKFDSSILSKYYSLSSPLVKIITNCLDKDPMNRWSVSELIKLVNHIG